MLDVMWGGARSVTAHELNPPDRHLGVRGFAETERAVRLAETNPQGELVGEA